MHIPCGLVARIRRFHRRGRGSIPRKGGYIFSISKGVEFVQSVFLVKNVPSRAGNQTPAAAVRAPNPSH